MTDTIKRAINALRGQGDEPLCAYLYDLASLEQHAKAMVAALPDNAQLFYAAKANPDGKVLAALSPIVHGFEAASGGELRWLQQQNLNKPIIFGGPGKLESELRLALNSGIEAIHVESQVELQRLATITEQCDCTAPLFLRMNISLEGLASTRLAMGGKPTPFGFDVSGLGPALDFIKRHPRLKLQGFHFHLLSHHLDDDNHLSLMRLYFRTFKHWCRDYLLDLPVINVGGGLGIDYQNDGQHFNWTRFSENLRRLIAQESLGDTIIRFESGRFVTGQCGYYVMEVLDIKTSHGEHFAIGRGGTHHFRTPAAQDHSHPFFIVPGERKHTPLERQKVTMVGQLCTPKDVLARQQWVSSLAIGDCVVFPLAGAYAWNISHQNFLMHPPPTFHYL